MSVSIGNLLNTQNPTINDEFASIKPCVVKQFKRAHRVTESQLHSHIYVLHAGVSLVKKGEFKQVVVVW